MLISVFQHWMNCWIFGGRKGKSPDLAAPKWTDLSGFRTPPR